MASPTVVRHMARVIVALGLILLPAVLESCGQRVALTASSSDNPSPTPSPSATTKWAMAALFRDEVTGNGFSIQLQGGRPDTGKFDYSVTGQGDYIGTATLSDRGHGVIGLSHANDTVYIPLSGEPVSQVVFRLDGAIVEPDNALTLDIWIDGRHVYFHTGNADPTLAAAVAEQAVAAFSTKNWDVCYGLLAPEAQVAFKSEQDFASRMNAANANVTSIRLSGTPTFSPAMGNSYFQQTLLLTERDSSGIKNYKSTLYLVYETGRWYMIGTDPPVPAP